MQSRFAIRTLIGVLLLGVFLASACRSGGRTAAERYFDSGRRFFEKEKFEEASIRLRNAVKADPTFVAAYYQLGLTERRRGLLQQASLAFSRTLELEPVHAGAAVELGEVFLMVKDTGRARELAESVLGRNPDDFSARVLLGKSFLGDKDFSQAEAEFEKAKVLKPDNPAIYSASGIAQIGAGSYSRAETNFNKALDLDKSRIESYQNLANLYIGLKRLAEAEQLLKEGMKNNPDNTRIHLALAGFYFRYGRLPEAESVVASVEKKTQDLAQLQSDLGDFWVSHNLVPQAVSAYQKSLSARTSVIVKKKLISAYITLGNGDKAAHWNDQILQANPKDHEGGMFQGAIAYLRGDSASAIVQLETEVKKNPVSVFGHYYLGTAYLAAGRVNQARAEFYECVKYDEKFVHAYLRLAEISLRKNDPEVAAEYADRVVTLNPWMLEGHLLRADAALVERDVNEAERALRRAVRLTRANYLIHERWALLYALKKNYRRAEQAYQHALASSANPEGTLARMSHFYIEHGQVTKGLEQVQQYAASHEPNAALYELQAQLHLARGTLAEAIGACKEALGLDPDRQRAHLYLGQALLRQGRLDEAATSYTRAIELDPQHLAAHLLLADLFVRQGKLHRAIEVYRNALEINPDSPVAQASMAWVLAEVGQELNWALSLAQRAKQQLPDDAAVSYALAWVYHKRGLSHMAIPLLRECLLQDSTNAIFQYHLGMVYVESGNREEGQKLLQAVLGEGLPDPYAGRAQKALVSLGAQ